MAWGLEAHREDLQDRDQPDEPFLLQHPFTTQQLPRALLTQLLDKASDPHLGTLSPEDCELEVKQGPEGWPHAPWLEGVCRWCKSESLDLRGSSTELLSSRAHPP